MITLYYVIFYKPLFNLLVFLYNVLPGHDIGIAIILLTIIIKILLLPLSWQATRSQKALQDIQPKINEIKEKYKYDKETQAKKLMELYKKEKVNPLSSCFPLLIQFPFLIALFQIFKEGFKPESLKNVYPFIHRPESLNPYFLHTINLAQPNVWLALLAGLAQYWQTKMLFHNPPAVKGEGSKDEGLMAMMNKQSMYLMPLFTVFIGLKFPGGLTLYWLVTTLLMGLQQKIIFHRMNKKKTA